MPSRRPCGCRAAWRVYSGRRPERRAERAAGIAGRRLDPDVVERALAQQLAVGHAVQRDAAGQAEIARAGFAR